MAVAAAVRGVDVDDDPVILGVVGEVYGVRRVTTELGSGVSSSIRSPGGDELWLELLLVAAISGSTRGRRSTAQEEKG
jgi:hypothetical protein